MTSYRLASETAQSTPLQKRVLNRVRIIILAVLILILGVSFVSRQTISLNYFAQFTEGALSAVETKILGHLTDPINTALRIANSSTNRLYAQGLIRLTTTAEFNATMNRLQTELLRAFDDVVSLRRNFYNGMRYIMRDGRVWGEVINLPNETRISAEVSRTVPADNVLLQDRKSVV